MRGTDAALLAGRLIFGGFWLYHAANHLLLGTAGLTAFAANAGVPFPRLAVILTGVLLLVGGASVVAGAWPRAGLVCIAVFLIGVTPTMHAFWTFDDPALRMAQLTNFAKNIALLGATFAMMAIPEPWPFGIGRTPPATQRGIARRPQA